LVDLVVTSQQSGLKGIVIPYPFVYSTEGVETSCCKRAMVI
jgi:hypothetical protein